MSTSTGCYESEPPRIQHNYNTECCHLCQGKAEGFVGDLLNKGKMLPICKQCHQGAAMLTTNTMQETGSVVPVTRSPRACGGSG
jgi:hypothetical protein